MKNNSEKDEKLYLIDNPSFSKDFCLDNYRGNTRIREGKNEIKTLIDEAWTVILDDNVLKIHKNEAGLHECDLSCDISQWSQCLKEAVENGRRLICYDAIDIYLKLIAVAETDTSLSDTVWDLIDRNLLWDIGLLEQRIAWSIEDRAISFPKFTKSPKDLVWIEKYHVRLDDRHKAFREILSKQVSFLVENLSYLQNDMAGREFARKLSDQTRNKGELHSYPHIACRNDIHANERTITFAVFHGWRIFGPGGIGIDLKGAIVQKYLSQCSWTQCLRKDEVGKLDSNLKSLCGNFVKLSPLKKYVDVENTESNTSVWDDVRFLEGDDALAQLEKDWQKTFKISLGDTSVNHPRSFPKSESSRISPNFNHWAANIPCSGNWLNLAACQKALRWEMSKGGRDSLFQCESMPYLRTGAIEYVKEVLGEIPAAPTSNVMRVEFSIPDLEKLAYVHAVALFGEPWGQASELFGENSGAMKPIPPHKKEFASSTGDSNAPVDHENMIYFPRADSWTDIPTFFELYLSSRTEREKRFCMAVVSGIVFCPEITSDLSDAVVRALHEKTEEFNRRWKNIVECDKASVSSGYNLDALMRDAEEQQLPAKLLDKDRYLNIASVVVDGYIRGQRITDIVETCREKHFTDGIADYQNLLKNMFSWLSLSSPLRNYYDNYYPLAFLVKCGIDPLVPKGSLDNLRLMVNGKFVDPKLPRREKDMQNGPSFVQKILDQVTIRNAISGAQKKNDGHKEFLGKNFLPIWEEVLKRCGISNKPGQELGDFFYKSNAISWNGKVGRTVFEQEKIALCAYESVDDLKKTIAYSLIRSGKKLLGIYGSTFVLEFSCDELERDSGRSNLIEICRNIISDAIMECLELSTNIIPNHHMSGVGFLSERKPRADLLLNMVHVKYIE